jgi:hypothetical protein
VEEYRGFLGELFEHINSGRKLRPAEEMEQLRSLPDRRIGSANVRVRVNSGSLMVVERNSYSVNSRLIGEIVEARMFSDHLEVWYGGQKVDQFSRLHEASFLLASVARSLTALGFPVSVCVWVCVLLIVRDACCSSMKA